MEAHELKGPAQRERWNEFIRLAPAGDILQSWEWGDLKARSGWTPVRILVTDDGAPVAAVSILVRQMRDLLRDNLKMPSFFPVPNCSICYAPHGPVVSWDRSDAVRGILEAATRQTRQVGGFVLKVEPAVEECIVADQLNRAGFRHSSASEGFGGTQPRCVMQLSLLPDLETILAECKQKTRYNIRLAQRKGVTVREGEGDDDLRAFYDLLLVTAERDRFRVRGFSYYQDMASILGSSGMMKLFLAEHEGKLLSGALLFTFGRTCVYAYGASSNENRQLMPNYLMQWDMIRWAKLAGFSTYDFRGVSPTRDPSADDHLGGLNRFKEGFGAQFVEYVGDFDRVLNPAWNALWSRGMPRLRSMLKGSSPRPSAAEEG